MHPTISNFLDNVPTDVGTLSHLILPIFYHIGFLTELVRSRRKENIVFAFALFSMAQAIFAAVPATIIPAIVAPRGWPEEKQAAWSMLFFTLPAMMESLVALVFLLQHVNRSFTALARARVNAESRKVSSGSELGAEAKKDR